MGDKARARETAAGGRRARPSRAPTARSTTPTRPSTVAEEIGYPVALKAAGGGGGRGIRIAERRRRSCARSFATASREARGAFDDARIYVERFVAQARHVEVQVLGDGDRRVHLFERECSLQRRRQKVVEETPGARPRAGGRATALCDGGRRALRRDRLPQRGHGRVPVDDETGEFFFIEMNTRIQVEHPVTELVTGSTSSPSSCGSPPGEPLWFAQEDVDPRGCAIELRLNAEDPANGFLPSPGPIDAAAAARAARGCASTPGWSPAARCRPTTTR